MATTAQTEVILDSCPQVLPSTPESRLPPRKRHGRMWPLTCSAGSPVSALKCCFHMLQFLVPLPKPVSICRPWQQHLYPLISLLGENSFRQSTHQTTGEMNDQLCTQFCAQLEAAMLNNKVSKLMRFSRSNNVCATARLYTTPFVIKSDAERLAATLSFLLKD